MRYTPLLPPQSHSFTDSLIRTLPLTGWNVQDKGLTLVTEVRRFWERDSNTVARTLAEMISDDRDITTFTSVLAADLYGRLSGRSEPLMTVFISDGEPSSRLGWVLMALRPPIDSMTEAQVFGYACDAAWILLESKHDSFLHSRTEAEHSVFSAIEADGVLSNANRLITGSLHADMQQLIRETQQTR